MIVVPILLYHSISSDPAPWIRPFAITPETFCSHLDLVVDRGGTALTVSAFAAALTPGARALPERPILITFDDGFADFHEHALPALADRGLGATLYVTTGFVGRRPESGQASGERMLDWAQLAEVRDAGIEIGGHSHSHPQLDALPGTQAAGEISRCKEILEGQVGVPVTSFAYPHGYSSPNVRRLVAESGYRSACGVKNALSSLADDPFSLARLMVEDTTPVAQVAAWLAGEDAPVAPVRERLRTRGWRIYRRAGVALGLRSPVELLP
jgi:peptidoglycan/xylan/chitin deacetylase (PgdA/CDA1 family)